MESLATALFLCLGAARHLLEGLVKLKIVGQSTVEMFDRTVQTIKTDCENGGYDVQIAEKAVVVETFDPTVLEAKAPYDKLD